jgi:hypothetical protein
VLMPRKEIDEWPAKTRVKSQIRAKVTSRCVIKFGPKEVRVTASAANPPAAAATRAEEKRKETIKPTVAMRTKSNLIPTGRPDKKADWRTATTAIMIASRIFLSTCAKFRA